MIGRFSNTRVISSAVIPCRVVVCSLSAVRIVSIDVLGLDLSNINCSLGQYRGTVVRKNVSYNWLSHYPVIGSARVHG